MKRFLTLGALALSLAGVPTQEASAESNVKFGIGFNFNFCFEYRGNHQWCRPGCSQHGHQQDYVAVMPGHAHAHHHPQMQPFPPQPMPDRRDPRGDQRKQEETSLQWGYPSLGYSYYHPVSYHPAQYQQNVVPASHYYPQQHGYPPAYNYPNYYQAPGMTFDR